MRAAGTPGHAAAVIAVGDELLRGHTLDTNSNWLAQRLYACGYPVRRVQVVSDEEGEIVSAVRRELEGECDAIFVCGGLGPTPDDLTLGALAVALGRAIELDATAAAHIQKRLDWLVEIGRIPDNAMSAANRRMAEVPVGGVALHNSTGMAPGLAFPLHRAGEPARHLFVLPGVPRELKALFDEEIAPRYLLDGMAFTTAEVHFDRAVEAQFWDLLTRVGREFPEVSVGSYPQPDRGHLIIRVAGVDATAVEAAANLVRDQAPAPPWDPAGPNPPR
ncbi:MAG: competence/damage-inducible protein A [Candidatus Dormibacteria bacterium]